MNNELVQGSTEWKALRMSKLGGSDAPVIMGVSKFLTPFQLWEIKLGLREVEMNSAMKRGTEMEAEARKEFEHLHGVEVFPDVKFHYLYTWMMASLDGISLDGKTLVEIKCVNKNDHQTALDGKVPLHYYPQLQHQLAVTGLDYMYYFSYDPLNPATVIVTRDDDYLNDMFEKEKEFYRCMTDFDPPPLTDKDYVEKDDFMWSNYAHNYIEAVKKRKQHELHEEACKRQLIELAEGKNAKGGGIRLTRFVRRGNVQFDKIPELQGVNLEQYRKPPIESWRIGECDA